MDYWYFRQRLKDEMKINDDKNPMRWQKGCEEQLKETNQQMQQSGLAEKGTNRCDTEQEIVWTSLLEHNNW